MTKRETKQQIIDRLEHLVSQLRRDAELHRVQLNEARRRTIRLLHGGGELNFLPAAITKVDYHRDIREFEDYSGVRHAFPDAVRIIIECEGEVTAVPAYPEPRKKPAPELGWKILNEYADKIADRDVQGCFIADARTLESGFTSGELSEDIYRSMMRMLMPKEYR